MKTTTILILGLSAALSAVVSGEQQRISDCYTLPTREQRDACKAKFGTWEDRNNVPKTIFKDRPDYIASAQAIYELIQQPWVFTRVLHGLDGAPSVMGTFDFTADGRYSYVLKFFDGSNILTEHGDYRLLDARRSEFPQLLLNPREVSYPGRSLERVLLEAGMMGGTDNRFYIAIADARKATLFPSDCAAGCAARSTNLGRPPRN